MLLDRAAGGEIGLAADRDGVQHEVRHRAVRRPAARDAGDQSVSHCAVARSRRFNPQSVEALLRRAHALRPAGRIRDATATFPKEAGPACCWPSSIDSATRSTSTTTSTWPAAAQDSEGVVSPTRTRRASSKLSAIGHAHIDTAWLWPLAETHRKCERTFSTATTYMRDYPEYRFACSQAYQYDVIKRRNPGTVPAHQGTRETRPVGDRRRHVDRAGLQHPIR